MITERFQKLKFLSWRNVADVCKTRTKFTAWIKRGSIFHASCSTKRARRGYNVLRVEKFPVKNIPSIRRHRVTRSICWSFLEISTSSRKIYYGSSLLEEKSCLIIFNERKYLCEFVPSKNIY